MVKIGINMSMMVTLKMICSNRTTQVSNIMIDTTPNPQAFSTLSSLSAVIKSTKKPRNCVQGGLCHPLAV